MEGEHVSSNETQHSNFSSESCSCSRETLHEEEATVEYEVSPNFPLECGKSKLISEALQKEDEFMEYLMSLPVGSSGPKEQKQLPQLMISTTSNVGNTSSSGVKVGLDHLDNLCKLMEQLGDLREQNSKLQRRVQYLEDLKNLQEMHKQMQQETSEKVHEGTATNRMNEGGALLETECFQNCLTNKFVEEVSSNKQNNKYKSAGNVKVGRSLLSCQQRERSKSIGVGELKSEAKFELGQKEGRGEERRRCPQRRSMAAVVSGGKAKVSKWTKVKEAFRWEKAAVVNVASLSSSSSSEDLHIQLNFSDVLAELGPLRSASATDSSSRAERRVSLSPTPAQDDISRRSKSLDGDNINGSDLLSSKDTKNGVKSHKTPWSKVKDIIQTRKDSLNKRHRKGERCEQPVSDAEELPDSSSKRPRIDVVSNSSHGELTHSATVARRLSPMLTLTLPSSEELRTLAPSQNNKPPSSPQADNRQHKTSYSSAQGGTASKSPSCDKQIPTPWMTSSSAGTSPPVPRRASKWTKVKKAFLTSAPGRRDDNLSSSLPSSPKRNSSFFYEMDGDEGSIHAEVRRNYEELQQKLSYEFHQKLHEWENMKTVSPIPSCGSVVGCSTTEEGFLHHDKGFRRKMEEWERIKSSQNSKNRESVNVHPLDEDNLSPDFKKKLLEWQKMKGSLFTTMQADSNFPSHPKKKIGEWQIWRTVSGASGKSDDQDLQNKRLSEWDQVNMVITSSPCEPSLDAVDRMNPVVTHSQCIEMKGGGQNNRDKIDLNVAGQRCAKPHQKGKIQKEKELQWLEKELQKIQREKQRLEREREKYLEREARFGHIN